MRWEELYRQLNWCAPVSRLSRWFGRTRRERRTNADAIAEDIPHRGTRVDESSRSELARGILHELNRRDLVRMGAVAGGGVLAGILAQRAWATPGDGIPGTTITDTDIDAKRIAGIRIATEFASAKHAGTPADPWPGSAIQAALDDLPVSGGIVFVPSGTYNASNPIAITKSNVTLTGTGSSSRVITDGSGYTDNVSAMIGVSGQFGGVTIEKLLLDGTNTDTCRGILITGGSKAIISQCYMYNWLGVLSQRGRGISVSQNPVSLTPPYETAVVESCHFFNNQIGAVFHRCVFTIADCVAEADRTDVFDGLYVEGETRGVLSNNIVRGMPRAGINIQFTDRTVLSGNQVEDCGTGIQLGTAVGCTVQGNRVERCRMGMWLAASSKHNLIANNIARDNALSTSHGIQCFNAQLNLFLGNLCDRNGRSGIACYAGSHDNVIEANQCFNNGVQGAYAGIEVRDSNDCYVKGNKCFDDQLTKTQDYGILTGGTADFNVIIDNDVRNNQVGGLQLTGANNIIRDNRT